MLQDKSKEVKEGLRRSFHSPESKVANCVCYGYTKISDVTLSICESEAEVVKIIFARYNSRDSLGEIAYS